MSITPRVSLRELAKLSEQSPALDVGAAESSVVESQVERSADSVLARLLEGNERFAKGEAAHPRRKPEDFAPLAEGQAPIAVVVGCADSRVSPELIFDQGVGDLFVVRLAGNVISGAGGSVKGSIEFAVAELGVPLVMVLGHSQCGAVTAAIKHIDAHDALPGSLGNLIEALKPAVALAQNRPGNLLDNVIIANVERGVARVKALDPLVTDPVKKGIVKVVGAVYDLRSGRVTVIG
jgi:carbonic anhydrase